MPPVKIKLRVIFKEPGTFLAFSLYKFLWNGPYWCCSVKPPLLFPILLQPGLQPGCFFISSADRHKNEYWQMAAASFYEALKIQTDKVNHSPETF
jgi:hypothetical protein